MFGSQALELAIGLALMFFLFASAASAVTEIYSAVFKKRSSDLEKALVDMLKSGGDLPAGIEAVTPAEAQALIKRATGNAKASYLSAKSFADAATELVSKGHNIGVLQDKMNDLAREARGRLDLVKAGLETWFDQTMAVAQDRYTRWASYFLLGTGLALTIGLNASAVHVGNDLWRDASVREAVVDAAGSTEEVTATCDEEGSIVEQAQCDVGLISAFNLPIGWDEDLRTGWNDAGKAGAWWWATHLVGWALTAALIMLGAPFWFDLLGKLVNLRSSGTQPKPAPADAASYSTRVVKQPPNEPNHDRWVPNVEQLVENLRSDGGDSGPHSSLTVEALDQMPSETRLELYRTIPPTAYLPPAASTDTQNVDWLATALNLGVPMNVVNDRAAAAN